MSQSFARLPAVLATAAIMSFGLGAAPMSVVNFSGAEAVTPRLPKKQLKAAKRLKYAEPEGGWPRSKNPPTKRKLKANRVHVSRRVRRKHRRARR